MIVGLCKFSLNLSEGYSPSDRARLLQRIKEKAMAHFRVVLSEAKVIEAHAFTTMGFALVGNDENAIRDKIDKLLNFFEEHEGLRIEEEKRDLFDY